MAAVVLEGNATLAFALAGALVSDYAVEGAADINFTLAGALVSDYAVEGAAGVSFTPAAALTVTTPAAVIEPGGELLHDATDYDATADVLAGASIRSHSAVLVWFASDSYNGTAYFEQSPDGDNWFPLLAQRQDDASTAVVAQVTVFAATHLYAAHPPAGWDVRVRLAGGSAGSLTVRALADTLADAGRGERSAFALADGADATQGAVADAMVAAGAAGTISAKLRRATQGLEDLKTLIVLAAGSARIGKVTLRNAANDADIDSLAEATFTGRVGATDDAAATSTGTFSVIALLKGILAALLPAADFQIGVKTSITTAVAISASSIPCRAILIQARPNNTEPLLIGNVTDQHFWLAAGESLTLRISNVNLVYAKQSASGTLALNWITVP